MRWLAGLVGVAALGCGRHNFDAPDAAQPPSLLPVLHYTFDTGLTHDESAGQHDTTCVSCPTIIPGRVGIGAAHFNVDQCLLVSDVVDLRPDELTVTAWVKASSAGMIIGRTYMGGSTTLNTFELLRSTNTTFQFSVGTRSAFHPADSAWRHLTGTYAGGVTTFYVDGVVRGGVAAPLNYDDGQIRIGCDFDNGIEGFYFTGDIDDLRFYDRSLSAAEIAELMALI